MLSPSNNTSLICKQIKQAAGDVTVDHKIRDPAGLCLNSLKKISEIKQRISSDFIISV